MNTKKVVKIVAWVLGILIGIPLIAVLSLPLWLGPLVKPTANALVPTFTKTAFNLGTLYVNPYTLFAEIGDLTLANPEGFAVSNAVTLGSVRVDVKLSSVFTDVIVFEEIALEDLYVSSVANAAGESNLDVIMRNVQSKIGSGKKAEEARQPSETQSVDIKPSDIKPDEIVLDENKPAEAKPSEAESAEAKPAEAQAKKSTKLPKIIIERLIVKGVRFQKGRLTLPAPGFELHDLGKDSGGYDPQKMGQAILKEAWASLLASGADALKLGAAGLDAMKNAAGSANESLKKSTEATAEALKKSGAATTEALKKSADSLKGAADSLKGLFK